MSHIPADFDARAIANAILKEAWVRGCNITNLKLQKLLFLCHAFYCVENEGANLIQGSFEAWQFGPVHRGTYEAFRHFEGNPITEETQRLNPVTGEKSPLLPPESRVVLDIIAKVVKFYGDWSAGELVDLTHTKDGPWDFVVQTAANQANMGLKIDNQIITERFKYLWFGKPGEIRKEEPNDEKPLVA